MVNKNKENLFDRKLILDCFFCVFIALTVCIFIYNNFSGTISLVDTYEHVHASWLVSEGKVPYLDFFEHHNPLLWFLFAPITKLMEGNVNIVYVARLFSLFMYLCCFGITYKIIAKHLANPVIAKLSVLSMLLFPFRENIFDFRPDAFMIFCSLSGLYFFFNYLDTQRRKDLCKSYFFMAMGFLFLQKSLFFLVGFALANIYLIIKHKVKLKDFLYACLCGAVPLFLFAIYLFATGSFAKWFHCNVVFNSNLSQYYVSVFYDEVMFDLNLTAISLFFVSCFFGKDDKDIVMKILIVAEGIFCLFFALRTYYFLMYMFLIAVILGKIAYKYIYGKNVYSFIFYVLILICLLNNLNLFKTADKYVNYTRVATEIYKKGDIIYSPNVYYGNLFNHDVSYYWFGYSYIPVIESLYGDEEYSMDEIISSQKADYVYYRKAPDIMDDSVHLRSLWLKKRNVMLINKAGRSKNSQFYLDNMYVQDDAFYRADMDNLQKYYELIYKDDENYIWKKK